MSNKWHLNKEKSGWQHVESVLETGLMLTLVNADNEMKIETDPCLVARNAFRGMLSLVNQQDINSFASEQTIAHLAWLIKQYFCLQHRIKIQIDEKTCDIKFVD